MKSFLFTLFAIFLSTHILFAQNKIGLQTNSPDAPVHIWSPGQLNTPGGLLLLGNRSEAHMKADFNYIQSRFGVLSTLNLMINPEGGNVGIHTWSPNAPFHIWSPGQVSNPSGQFLLGNRNEAHLEMDFDFLQSRYSATSFLNFRLQPNGGSLAVGDNALFVSENKNVGIGVSDPKANLHVASGSSTTKILITPEGASQQNSEIEFSEGSSDLFTMSIFHSGTEDGLQIYGKSVNNVYGPHLHIDRISGDIGIKTNNPLVDLHVSSNNETTQMMLTPTGNGLGHSEIKLSEDDDGTFGMTLRYDGQANEMQVVGNTPGTTEPHLRISRNSGFIRIPGNVSIGSYGDVPNGYKFAVDGKIRAEGLKCDLSQDWPDYVFDKDYSLMSIKEVSEYINGHGHLPGFDSAETLKKEGLDFETVSTQQQQKIEEMMLYIIELSEQVELLKTELANSKK